jgi:hypothetical protein
MAQQKSQGNASLRLLVRRVRSIGAGAREIEEYELDTGLLRELLDIEKQVAKELGQLENKPAGHDGCKQADRDIIVERIIADSAASELACRLLHHLLKRGERLVGVQRTRDGTSPT